jgi:hypothetical protein
MARMKMAAMVTPSCLAITLSTRVKARKAVVIQR